MINCGYCNRSIFGRYMKDSFGTPFCEEHLQLPRCAYCGRPALNPNVNNYTPLRCNYCCSSAIENMQQAEKIFARLQIWFNERGLFFHQLPLHIELASQLEVNQLSNAPPGAMVLGTTRINTQIRGRQKNIMSIESVVLVSGLPVTLFEGVTVHELGHVWLAIQNITSLPHWANEGFCELLAHQRYSTENTPESKYYMEQIEQNPNPTYGDGFRQLYNIVSQKGWQNFIYHLAVTKYLPTL